MAEIGVIGSGSWGTALALVLNKNGHHVTIWSYLKEEADEIRERRENPSKLPGIHIPEEIEITTDLQGSVEGKMWSFLQFRLWQPELRRRKCARM